MEGDRPETEPEGRRHPQTLLQEHVPAHLPVPPSLPQHYQFLILVLYDYMSQN